MATKTQKELIREYLERGNSLTPMDALELFGCFRLATRIFELKREGMDIVTEMVETRPRASDTPVIASCPRWCATTRFPPFRCRRARPWTMNCFKGRT